MKGFSVWLTIVNMACKQFQIRISGGKHIRLIYSCSLGNF